jgi:uncharacterized metal-binding protein YceD (DUF177 family)
MEIRITDLPTSGLELRAEELSLAGLIDRYGEDSSDGVTFNAAPIFSGKVVPCHGGAILTGELKFSFKQPCSVCTDNLDDTKTLEVNIMFRQRPDGSDPASEEFEDDLGLTYFEGDKIFVDDSLYSEIIVNIPIVNRPAESDCGDCTICGKNFAKLIPADEPTNTMQALFDAALKKTSKSRSSR